MTTKVAVHPVDAGRWPDLVALFGPSGAYSGCWCMWFRVPGAEFSRNGNAGNKRALHRITAADEPVGLLGYVDGSPAGWASVAPRTAYTRVLRSPALKPDDPGDAATWSVPCFFTHRAHRGTGIAGALLDAAVDHARTAGARDAGGLPGRPGRRPATARGRAVHRHAGDVREGRVRRPQATGDRPARGRPQDPMSRRSGAE